jgi:hypothetical protein
MTIFFYKKIAIKEKKKQRENKRLKRGALVLGV